MKKEAQCLLFNNLSRLRRRNIAMLLRRISPLTELPLLRLNYRQTGLYKPYMPGTESTQQAHA